ncbi:MAG: ROK family glucokinase [Bowdeniella nasicola]|nr:ROK family glucokinase [Bowdeniella nasicola]
MATVGVDIGGTKIAAGVVDVDGTLLADIQWPTTPDDPAAIDRSIIKAIEEFSRSYSLTAVGVAACGYVAADRSTVQFAGNVNWRNYPLGENLAAALTLPVVVENDANAAGWAEFAFGAGRENSSMVMFTVGTGLGGAIVLDNKLVRGGFGGAGEVGHMVAVPHGHYCGCGHEGCFEMYASGTALTRAARRRSVALPTSMAAISKRAKGKKIRGQHVSAAAEAGDAVALEMVASLGTWLGRAAASLTAIVDPEIIIIGGGVVHAGDVLLEPARRAFRETVFAAEYRQLPSIEAASFGNDGGMIGAGDLARYR